MITTNIATCAIPVLPNPVLENIIFSHLSLPELGACCRVSKAWKEMAKKQLSTFSYEKAFGPKEWHIYFGAYLRNVRRLPSNITEIMNSACPFWPDKKVHETHLLVLVPQTINGRPLTLQTLGELVQKPLKGLESKYSCFYLGEYVDEPAELHWSLLTRTVIEDSRSKTYEEEEAILDQYSQKTNIAYEIPTILDAAVCNFVEYIRSGIWPYGKNPWTYSWCQENYNASWMFVGGGSDAGLSVYCDFSARAFYGIGGLRKL